ILIDLFTSLFFLSPRDVPSPNGNLPEITVEPIKQWWDGFVETSVPPPPLPPSRALSRHTVGGSQNSYSWLWVAISVLGAVISLNVANTLRMATNSAPVPPTLTPAPTSPS